MEFSSTISTTREQSQQLLALGLKPETADMVWHFTNSKAECNRWELKPYPPTLRGAFWTPERISKLKHPFLPGETGEEVFDRLWGKDIPAWSLSRLIELLPDEIVGHWAGAKTVYHPELIKQKSDSGLPYVLSIRKYTADCLVGTHKENSPIACCISMIGWLIEHKHLDPEYYKK